MRRASVLQGASILLMLSTSLLGEQKFKKGLIQYLNQYKGLNTNTEDLWNSLTQVTAVQFLQECLCYVPLDYTAVAKTSAPQCKIIE